MRALVSGATGFIGRALVSRLQSEGHEVCRLVRSAPGAGEALLDLTERRLDASRLPGGSLAGVDVVFHLAGEPITPTRWGVAKRERIRSSRVASTDVLARAIAAEKTPPPVFVCGSAVGFYGEREEQELDEESAVGTGFLAEVCQAWEAATAPARAAGVRVVNVRTGLVLGAGGGLLATMAPLFRLGLGGRLGSGRQWMSWIALEDEVGALVHAGVAPSLEGPCNLVSPHPVRNSEFTAALAAAVHRPALFAVPRAAIELALGKQTAAEFVLPSQRVVPRALGVTGFVHRLPELSEALAAALGPAAGSASGGRLPVR